MAYWLLKTEPDDYAWSDLVCDKQTMWDGVANNAALKHMRDIKKGDLAFIYHTGDERQIMGIAEITKAAYPDPKEDEPRLVAVDVKIKSPLKRPVSLVEMKADPMFTGWDLLRQPRLSVMPVPEKLWKHIEALGKSN